MVEPAYSFEGGELDGLDVALWSQSLEHLGLVKLIDRLGLSNVIAVADAAVRWLNTGFGGAFGGFYGYLLPSTIAVMKQAATIIWRTIVQSLLQGIQYEAGMCCPIEALT